MRELVFSMRPKHKILVSSNKTVSVYLQLLSTRFFHADIVTVETGEEEEETRFEARAKLFVNTGKEWKERGVGLFKVNVMDGDADVDTGKPKLRARFIMRADGTHRVSINSPITPEVQIQDKDGAEPKQNTVFFMGAIDGKMRLCLLRVSIPSSLSGSDG